MGSNHQQHSGDQDDYLTEDIDELIAVIHTRLAEAPHSVVVSDAQTGTSTIYGPYPDAHQAMLAVDAAVARDSGVDVTVTIARNATALP